MLGLTIKKLPFTLPEIRLDPVTGKRDGRPIKVQIPMPNGDDLAVGCWVSSRTSASELASIILSAEAANFWDSIYRAVMRMPLIPEERFRLGVSREGEQLRYEWLDDSRQPMRIQPGGASKSLLSTWCNFTIVTNERKVPTGSRSINVETTCYCENVIITGNPGTAFEARWEVLHCWTEDSYSFEWDFGEDPMDTSDWSWGPEIQEFGDLVDPQHYTDFWVAPFEPYPTDGFYQGQKHTFALTYPGSPVANLLRWTYNGAALSCDGQTSCQVTLTADGHVKAELDGHPGVEQEANVYMYPCDARMPRCYVKLNSTDSTRLRNVVMNTRRNPSVPDSIGRACDSLFASAQSTFGSPANYQMVKLGNRAIDQDSAEVAEYFEGVIHLDEDVFHGVPDKVLLAIFLHETAHKLSHTHLGETPPYTSAPFTYVRWGYTTSRADFGTWAIYQVNQCIEF